jgi:hypothetical protein
MGACQDSEAFGKRRYTLQYPYNPWFCFMIHQVIDLVVTMDDRTSISWPRGVIAEKLEHFIHVWNSTNRFSCLGVFYSSLRFRYRLEGHNLSIVESPWLSKSRKSHGCWINAMQLCQCPYGFFPPIRGLSLPIKDIIVDSSKRM